jgi:hypothetical protein
MNESRGVRALRSERQRLVVECRFLQHVFFVLAVLSGTSLCMVWRLF